MICVFMSTGTKISNALLLLNAVMMFAILGFITDTSAQTKDVKYNGDRPTEIDDTITTVDSYVPVSENSNSTLSNTSSSSLHGNKPCPEGYFMDEGICRLKPSEQPNPPVSVPLCPPGYYAQSGGICEPIPTEGSNR